FAEVAIARNDDSVWCTWSPRWWDGRWVEPTVAQLQRRADPPGASAADIATLLRLPDRGVVRALDRLAAAEPGGGTRRRARRAARRGAGLPDRRGAGRRRPQHGVPRPSRGRRARRRGQDRAGRARRVRSHGGRDPGGPAGRAPAPDLVRAIGRARRPLGGVAR